MTTEKIAKPALRRLLASRFKIDVFIGFSLVALTGVIYRFGVAECRKNKYAEFYKNYDAEADFQRMRKQNLFQIVDAEGKMNKDF